MALHLITGYAGSEHITSKDQGAYNIATFGSGNFVLDRGEKFKNAVASNNSITIYDGEAMMQGRFIKMPSGTTESVTIENGASGQTRNDLICIRYAKNTTNNTESASLVVIKGTPNGGDPSYNTGLITDGDANVSDFPLYRVSLNGINISSVTALFSVKVSMVNYMDNYQMPKASKSDFGAVKVGGNINVSNGEISVPAATSSALGVVKNGTGINNTSGTLSLATATSSSLGGVRGNGNVKVDSNGDMNYTLPTASASAKGGVKKGTGVNIDSNGTVTVSVPSDVSTQVLLNPAIVVPAHGIVVKSATFEMNETGSLIGVNVSWIGGTSKENIEDKVGAEVRSFSRSITSDGKQDVSVPCRFINPTDSAVTVKWVTFNVYHLPK